MNRMHAINVMIVIVIACLIGAGILALAAWGVAVCVHALSSITGWTAGRCSAFLILSLSAYAGGRT